jgi:hypothetical protein
VIPIAPATPQHGADIAVDGFDLAERDPLPTGGEATLPLLPPRSPTACAPSRCPQGPPPDAGSPLEPQAQRILAASGRAGSGHPSTGKLETGGIIPARAPG